MIADTDSEPMQLVQTQLRRETVAEIDILARGFAMRPLSRSALVAFLIHEGLKAYKKELAAIPKVG